MPLKSAGAKMTSINLYRAVTGILLISASATVGAQQAIWESRPGARDFGPIVVVNGVLITGAITGSNGMVGLDANTGKVLWRAQNTMVSGPATDGSRVYAAVSVSQLVHRVVALDSKTGKAIWSTEGERFGGSNRVHASDGRVFIAGDDGNARAFDAATGKVLWTFQYSRGKAYCPTSINSADGRIYFGGGESLAPRSQGVNLWALDAATGKELWHFALKPETYSTIGECVNTPAVSNGVVAVTGSNLIHGLDASTGAVKWKQEVLGMVDGRQRRRPLSAPKIVNNQVFAIFEEGLNGWDLASGAPVFNFAGHFAAQQYQRDIQSADGRLYFTANFEQPDSTSNRQGFLYAVDIASQKVVWKHRANRPSQYSAIANWPTTHFTIVGDAIYYENHQLLAKVRR